MLVVILSCCSVGVAYMVCIQPHLMWLCRGYREAFKDKHPNIKFLTLAGKDLIKNKRFY